MKLLRALEILEENIGQPVILSFIDENQEDKDALGLISPFDNPDVIRLTVDRNSYEHSKPSQEGLGILEIPVERLIDYRWVLLNDRHIRII